jgi:hypothetical protein
MRVIDDSGVWKMNKDGKTREILEWWNGKDLPSADDSPKMFRSEWERKTALALGVRGLTEALEYRYDTLMSGKSPLDYDGDFATEFRESDETYRTLWEMRERLYDMRVNR